MHARLFCWMSVLCRVLALDNKSISIAGGFDYKLNEKRGIDLSGLNCQVHESLNAL